MNSMWGVPVNAEMYFGTPDTASSRPTAFVTITNCFGTPIQVPVPRKTDMYGNPLEPVPQQVPQQQSQRLIRTTDMYGNPLQPVPPTVASQCHPSTIAPSSLDTRNCSQTKTALYAEIVKDASNGESSGNNDSSEHDSSSDEDVSTSVEDDTPSSSSEDGSEYESSREVVDSDAERSTSRSDSSQ